MAIYSLTAQRALQEAGLEGMLDEAERFVADRGLPAPVVRPQIGTIENVFQEMPSFLRAYPDDSIWINLAYTPFTQARNGSLVRHEGRFNDQDTRYLLAWGYSSLAFSQRNPFERRIRDDFREWVTTHGNDPAAVTVDTLNTFLLQSRIERNEPELLAQSQDFLYISNNSSRAIAREFAGEELTPTWMELTYRAIRRLFMRRGRAVQEWHALSDRHAELVARDPATLAHALTQSQTPRQYLEAIGMPQITFAYASR